MIFEQVMGFVDSIGIFKSGKGVAWKIQIFLKNLDLDHIIFMQNKFRS